MRIKIGSKLLWYNKIALEIERIIGMQDVIHCSNFFEHWNKGHSDFEQSSTNNLGPGNGVVRCPGDKAIILVLGLDCVSSRMTWVNRLYDYKDGRLREWKKVFSHCSLQFGKKRNFMVKIFDIRRTIVKSGEQEVVAQIRSLPIKSRGLECLILL